jgi:hypothetical protein
MAGRTDPSAEALAGGGGGRRTGAGLRYLRVGACPNYMCRMRRRPGISVSDHSRRTRRRARAEATRRGRGAWSLPTDQLAAARATPSHCNCSRSLGAPPTAERSALGRLTSRSTCRLFEPSCGGTGFRRTAWDSARASYERAVELDIHLRARVLGGSVAFAAGQSLRETHSLRSTISCWRAKPWPSARAESLLIVFDSLRATLDEGELSDSASEQRVQPCCALRWRQHKTLSRMIPESWVALGRGGVHFGPGRGVSTRQL